MNNEQLDLWIEIIKATRTQIPSWRLGQTVFNSGVAKFEVCEKLRATQYDCFYNDNLVFNFMEQVLKEMNTNEKVMQYFYSLNINELFR